MDYKQKYKEALTWVESIYHELSHDRQMEAEAFFPELKESEDEKIRKEILSFCQGRADNYPNAPMYGNIRKWIAWLEKLKVFTEHDEGLYYFANSEFTYVGNPTSDDGLVLEKQAEQKKFIDNLTPQEAMDIAVAKCFDEQKPTDKTEPKFEVGDWIIRSAEGFKHNTYLVTEVKDYYVCEELKGRRVTFTFNDVHKNFKLWDISDAKDGDALAVKGAPFIYKKHDKDYVYLYCGVNLSNEFVEAKKIDSWNNNNKVYPATKEQRDTLFAKMEKSGYKWDAEKKELKLLITNGGDFCESENCEKKPDDKIEPIDEFEGLTDFESISEKVINAIPEGANFGHIYTALCSIIATLLTDGETNPIQVLANTMKINNMLLTMVKEQLKAMGGHSNAN